MRNTVPPQVAEALIQDLLLNTLLLGFIILCKMHSFLSILQQSRVTRLRDGIKSYGKFAILTRLKIDLETPPPLSLVQFFQRPGHETVYL